MAEDRTTRGKLSQVPLSEGGWKRNAAQIAAEQEALYQLRLQGHSLKECARIASERLGWKISESTAHRRITDEALSRVEPHREALVRMEVDRLDRYLLGLEAIAAEATKEADRIAAVNTALRVQERRAKMLGLDEPEKHEVHHLGEQDVELAAMIREEQAKQAREEAALKREVNG